MAEFDAANLELYSERTWPAFMHNEARYHAVAARLGLHTEGRIELDGDALFIPRFDRRVTEQGVERLGQETLASLAGIAAFGQYPLHNVLVEVLARYVSEPAVAIAEYAARDAVNLALGNTDNHFRNTAVTKSTDGRTVLAPLFDFAPMFLDQDGGPRVTRWGEKYERGYSVDWNAVIESLPLATDERDSVRMRLRQLGRTMRDLPDILATEGVDPGMTQRRAVAIANVTKDLGAL